MSDSNKLMDMSLIYNIPIKTKETVNFDLKEIARKIDCYNKNVEAQNFDIKYLTEDYYTLLSIVNLFKLKYYYLGLKTNKNYIKPPWGMKQPLVDGEPVLTADTSLKSTELQQSQNITDRDGRGRGGRDGRGRGGMDGRGRGGLGVDGN